jgi:biotin-dependent carboxylase-like uncharacterized protein
MAVSLQDFGRPGLLRFGMPQSGALDTVSLQVANILAGNEANVAAFEALYSGFAIKVEGTPVLLAAAGCLDALSITRGDQKIKIPASQSFVALDGDVVRCPSPKNGSVYYVAVRGGFELPQQLGSHATYVRANLGGFNGRNLRAGDVLLVGVAALSQDAFALDLALEAPHTIRVMRGPNDDLFPAETVEAFFGGPFKVTTIADRMGLRLAGSKLERHNKVELTGQATTVGALQVPGDGNPILLLADRGTTGGYPRIATVIAADIPLAGRLAPGMSIRFKEVGREEAVAALREQRNWLGSLPERLRTIPADPLSSANLLRQNLIGGVTAGADAP